MLKYACSIFVYILFVFTLTLISMWLWPICINNIRVLIKYAFRYASSKKTYMEKQLDLKMRSVDFGSQILFYAIKHLILFNYSLYRCFLQMWIYGHMAFKRKGVSKRVIQILFKDLKTKPFVQQILSSTACEWRS